MMYLRFFFWSLVVLLASVAALPLVPISVFLLADKETGRFPRWLRWLETPDALGWGAGTYEPRVKKIFDSYGKKVALTYWLWRNTAYGLRWWLRADPVHVSAILNEVGSMIPPRTGPWFWRGKLTDGVSNQEWFELKLGWSFRSFHLYLRLGWKLAPYFHGEWDTGSVGMFNGVTIRSDDWDDFPEGT